ncbi:male accessory gland serine protease inhibitor-like [Musca autumnalis]|uniref:male accessory gland serine protease inhibitor-like n=1 Tax=Musca autumnalis TaxID=221902 RepID=UPI003CF941D5
MKLFIVLFFALVAIVSSTIGLKNDICGLQYSKNGDNGISCDALFPSWTYRPDTNECISFMYGGCGGNNNRFSSKQECEKMCKE